MVTTINAVKMKIGTHNLTVLIRKRENIYYIKMKK